MKTNLHSDVKAPKGTKIAIAVSEYNPEITHPLLQSCQEELVLRGVLAKDISVVNVPGSFELPYVCNQLAEAGKFHAVIALGAVIRGETPHFDYLAGAVTRSLASIACTASVPVIYGVLTTDSVEQAVDRSGAKQGNKGWEAALSALEMVSLYRRIE